MKFTIKKLVPLSQPKRNFRLKAAIAAMAAVLLSPLATANPIGPTIVNGAATIVNGGNTLTITNTPGAILHWQQFNIDPGQTTQFNQQSAQSSVLNRVVGADPSQILGTLRSNGQVFLINPNGIMFGAGSVLDVNGLIASTLNITNADFLLNRMNFSGNNGASVINRGTITTPLGGSVYLIGNNVTNEGVIATPGGQVVLAAGNSVSMVDTATPHVSVTVSAPGGQAVNLGQVTAQGGSIDIYGALIRQQGIFSADSANLDAGGNIVLSATQSVDLAQGSATTANGATGGNIAIQSGAAGSATVAGAVEATGSSGAGGSISVLGDSVALAGSARLDASGATGGGAILAGGDYQGGNPGVQNASTTAVAQGAILRADATLTGDGGKLIAWSNNDTRAHGSFSARGGALSGNGGLIETSGHRLNVAGIGIDATAPNGTAGKWLLDPYDVTIQSAAGILDFYTPNFVACCNNSTVSNTVIQSALAAGTSVWISTASIMGAQTGNITVDAPISAAVTGVGTELHLDAMGSIFVNQPITSTAGPLNLALHHGSTGSTTLAAALSLAGGNLDAGNFLGQGGCTTGTGTLNVSSGTTTLTGTLAANALSIFGGILFLDGATATTLPTLTMSGGEFGGTGAITVTGPFSVSGGALAGAGTFTTQGASTIDITAPDSAFSVFGGKTWNNQGTLTIGGTSGILFGNGSGDINTLNNSGTLNLSSSSTLIPVIDVAAGSTGTVNNSGYLYQTLAGNHGVRAALNNTSTGRIYVNAGTLHAPETFTQAGLVDVVAGATFKRTNSVTNVNGFTNTGTLYGGGTFDVGAGTLVNQGIIAPGIATALIDTLTVNGNVLLDTNSTLRVYLDGAATGQKSGKLAVTGNLTLGGALQAGLVAGYTPANGDAFPFITVTGTSSGTFATTTNVPAGFSAGYNLAAGEAARLIYAAGPSTTTFTNASGGLDWSIPGNWSGNALPGSLDTALISAGHAVTHSTGTDIIAALTINSGNSLDVSGGSLTVSGITTLGGGLTISSTGSATLSGALNGGTGQVSISGGTLNLGATSTINSLSMSGSAILSAQNGFTNTGTLSGSGTIVVGTGASGLVNQGTINPGGAGAAGTLNVTGDVQLSTGSILNIDLGGIAAGQSDRLAVNGNVTLGGTLNASLLPGYTPANADAIPFVTATGTSSGTFATANLPAGFSAGYALAAAEAARLTYATAIDFALVAGTYSGTNTVTGTTGAGGAIGTNMPLTATIAANGSMTFSFTDPASGTVNSGTGQLLSDGTFTGSYSWTNGAGLTGTGTISGAVNQATGAFSGTWADQTNPGGGQLLNGTFTGQMVAPPTLAQCTAAPATPGCNAVLPSLATCMANPAAQGCSVVLPSLAACTAAPATQGCSVVLPSLAACTAAPATQGCSVVLPSLATCNANPAAPGCSAVLTPACMATPTMPGCSAVLSVFAGNYSGTYTVTGGGAGSGTWVVAISSNGAIAMTGSGTVNGVASSSSGTGQMLPDGTFSGTDAVSGSWSGSVNPAAGTASGTWNDPGNGTSGTFTASVQTTAQTLVDPCLINKTLCGDTQVAADSTTTTLVTDRTTAAAGNITYAASADTKEKSVGDLKEEAVKAEKEAEDAEKREKRAKNSKEKEAARKVAEEKKAEAAEKRAEARVRETETEARAADAEVKAAGTPEERTRAEGRKAIAESKRAEAEVKKAEVEAKQAEAEMKTTGDLQARAAAETKKAEAETRKAEAEVKKAEADVKKVETEIKQAESEAKKSSAPEDKAKVEIKKAEAESKKAEVEVKKAEAESKSAKAPEEKAKAEEKIVMAEAKKADAEAKKAEAEAAHADDRARKSDSPVEKRTAETRKAEAEAKKAEAEAKKAEVEVKTARDPESKGRAEAKVAKAEARKAEAEAEKADSEAKMAEVVAKASGKPEAKKEAETKKAEVEVKKAEAEVKKAEAEVKTEKDSVGKAVAEVKKIEAEARKAEAEVKHAEQEAKQAKEESKALQSADRKYSAMKKAEASEAKAQARRMEAEAKKMEAEVKRVEVEMKQAEAEVREAKAPEQRAAAEKRFEEKRVQLETKRGEAEQKMSKAEALNKEAINKESEFREVRQRFEEKAIEAFGSVDVAAMSRNRVKDVMAARHELKKEVLGPALSILAADPKAANLKTCGQGGGDVCIRPPVQAIMAAAAEVMPRVPVPIMTPVTSFLPGIQRKVAVVIGINAYQDPNIPSLNGAINDADEVGKTLKEKLGYDVQVVHNGSRADIVRSLNKIADETGSKDSVLVYYAGHGYQMEDTKDGYWIPSDASTRDPGNWISNADIGRMLANIPAKQMILVSDSCFSGTLTSEQKMTSGDVAGKNAQEILGKRSVIVMSSGGEEPVLDEGKDGHSVFTWHLIDKIGKVEQYKNGIEVFGAIKDGVSKDGIPQTPQYGASITAGHTSGGDYLFEVRKY